MEIGGAAFGHCDQRQQSQNTGGIAFAGIDGVVDAIVSADDSGLASKPAPDGLLYIARTMGVSANRLAMIGDTATDMLAGRSAGVGLVIGVLSGLATSGHLAPLADAVVPDIHSLGVLGT